MIKKILDKLIIKPINSITTHYEKKEIACAWCFKKQSINAELKADHVCCYCGKVFYVTNNKEFKA